MKFKDALVWFGIIAGIMLALAVVAAYFGALEFGLFKYFAPKQEAVRRQTFEQSQAYNEGMIRDLQDMQREYVDPRTTEPQRAVLRATIMHRYAAYDVRSLPIELQSFYESLQGPKQ